MSASGDLFPAELRVALAMGNYHFQFCRFLGTLVLDPGLFQRALIPILDRTAFAVLFTHNPVFTERLIGLLG